MSDTDTKMTGRRKKSFTSKNWYFKNPACAYFPSYALMQTNKRRRQSEPPTILPRIESLPAPPPDYPGSESPEYLSFKGANHCTAANSANTSFCTLSSHSSEGRGRLPSEYCIPNKRPRSYTTVFVSLFVFVLIVAITFLIGLGILTDGFKHLTVEERCRERWTTKPSLTAFSSNSRESNQQFPHSRPILPSSNGINLPLPSLPPSSPPSSSLQQPSQQIKSFSTNTNSNSNVCLTPDCVRIASSILTNMNQKVNPCENFYEFACGSYNGIKQVPESEKKITLFTEARTRLKYEIRELLDDTSLRENNNNKTTSDITKLVYIYYDSCMDDQAQDMLDLMPIFSLISSFGGWALLQNAKFEERDFSWEILETNLQLLGINGLFKLTIKQSMPITISSNGAANGAGYLIISQPQLLLGDRKLYSNSLGKNEYLQNYRTYMMDLLELFGADSEASEPQLNNVLNFERKIANITTPSSKLVKVNIQTLKTKFPKIIWKNFFNTEFFDLLPGFTESNLPLLVDMEYLQKLQTILSTTESQTINDYLMWKLLSSFNSYLPQRYRIPHETINTLLKGQTIKPLWEECINEVIERFPIPMITIYNRLFNGGRYSKIEKSDIEKIIGDLKEALSQIILNIDWMDEETRAAANEKLKRLKVNFNILENFQTSTFENEIMTQFNGLKLIGNTYFENTVSIRKLSQKNEFKKLNSSNFLNNFSSLTFEAFIELIPFNLYQNNEIILPTSLLQFPFYVLNAPNSINYGSIGAIISRELTHNFDDYGSNFGETGARKNWWKEDTIKFFDSKKQCFIAQYNNKADTISGKKLDGKRTLRENIADNGSLRTAYAAYNLRLARQPDTLKLPALSNYTDHQLYFIAYANTYCESVKINSAQQLLDSEKTSPALFRVNVPLQNFPAFSQAFNCPIGSGMNPYEKCRICTKIENFKSNEVVKKLKLQPHFKNSIVFEGYDKKFKQKLLNKSSDLYSNTLSIIDKVEAKKNWKKESSNTTNKSILSLHISVYENSLEAAAFDLIDTKNVAFKMNNIKLNKLFTSSLFVQNPFEFLRQQEANLNKESEVMKFKANQKLLNPVQTTPSKNVQITNPATAGSSAPAQTQISSNNNNKPKSFTPEPIDPSIHLPSQEILRDLSKETELIRASDEKSADKNENADEYYKYFWCLKLSVRKVATNFSIFLLFFDLFNISLAYRVEYLNYQLLYILSIFGPLALIFGVNVETYFNFAFVTAYFATIIRIIINGILIWIYYDKMVDSKNTEEKFQRFLNMATYENLTDKFEASSSLPPPPHRNSNLFRTIYPFTVLMGICGIMILLQIWALAVAIPCSHSWIKKKGTHVKK